MIRIICIILAIVMKDWEMCLNNSNLSFKKIAIGFELLAQKGEISKQIANPQFYKY